ncbi:TetR/AcrR family transcriptional regulator [Gorillibacterium timonense]|uniref:TetR/AcrR family transcriptional regulator n=1 Tax=Gorillibacterium timonense TaxID=1689269 RepID=UPI00071DB6BD|nr:TetR/AcrR family transcriptional regulator [Gorillibacterium timonense]
MPRFSEKEKERIRERLLVEGERLFTAHGIKKVTIDDLVGAVGIAKASFYTFYESKEYLFLDITQGLQKTIFNELNLLLDSNGGLPRKERVRQVFAAMANGMLRYPILSQIDTITVEQIARKVSKERLLAFDGQQLDAAQSLHDHGIPFTCDIQTASYAFQALYHSWMFLQEKGEAVQTSVIELMLNGVIDQIVVE